MCSMCIQASGVDVVIRRVTRDERTGALIVGGSVASRPFVIEPAAPRNVVRMRERKARRDAALEDDDDIG